MSTEALDRIGRMAELEPATTVALYKHGEDVTMPPWECGDSRGKWFCTVVDPRGNVWIEAAAESPVQAVEVVWSEFNRIRDASGGQQRWS